MLKSRKVIPFNNRSTSMWNFTSYDINRIKGQLQARRARIDARYAEETKALDADFADLETLERVASALSVKYKADEPAEPPEATAEDASDDNPPGETQTAPEAQLATTSGDGAGVDAKLGSRWRLALRERPVVSEAE
jgi:hypothetical protein